MERKKLLFIFNPYSGKGQIRVHLVEILDTFVKAGYEVTVHPTQCPEDALDMVAERADDFDLVVCSGGDGTLDEVVTGLMRGHSLTPIGYIPAGSTNDFAQSLEIPTNMLKAAETAVLGTPFPCDVGEFNDDTFIYVAAFGLFTDVSYQTNQRLKNILGHLAYVIEASKRLMTIPSYYLTIEVNGETIRDEFVYGMVTNSVSVGGMKNLTGKTVALDDGEFEVTFVRMPQNPLQLNDILTNLVRPRECDTPYIYSCKAEHIEIHCEEAVPWTLDGEYGGEHKDVRINNRCRRMTFMV